MSKHVFQSSDRMAPYRLPEAQKKSLKLKVSSLAYVGARQQTPAVASIPKPLISTRTWKSWVAVIAIYASTRNALTVYPRNQIRSSCWVCTSSAADSQIRRPPQRTSF